MDSTQSATQSIGAGAAIPGSGINWAGAGVTAGASALTGILSAMYQAEQERKRKIAEVQKQASTDAGNYGANQQQQMQNMMQNWQGALK